MKYILTVDPGMNTGWAYWCGWNLVDYGQITVKKSPSDIAELIDRFSGISFKYENPEDVYIEVPEVWTDSSTSIASMNSGDLIKLSLVVGGYYAVARREWSSEAKLVLARTWKKQLSKDAVKIRVQRALGVVERSSHINDAIGLGLFVQKRFTIPNVTRPFR